MFRFLFLLVLLFPTVTFAATATGPKVLWEQVRTPTYNSVNLLAGVALNAAAGLRTITVLTEGYNQAEVCWQATRVAYTAITVTPTCSGDGGTNYNSIPSTSITAGVGTNSAYSDLLTTSSSASMCFIYPVNACSHMKFLFAGTSAGASDLITAQVRIGVGP